MPFETAIYFIIAIYQLFEMISREGLAVDRMHFESINKVSSKHLYLNNVLKSSDLYYYRNLSIIWNDLIRSCNNHIHLETFLSIETLFLYIFFGFQLPDFWYASNNYQILFPKYRFLTKSGIFIWWFWTNIIIFKKHNRFHFFNFSFLLFDIYLEWRK